MRKFQKFYILIILAYFLCGCTSSSQKENILRPQNTAVNAVIDLERLKQGGNLLIAPFRAGVNVVSTAELDKVALSIIQGLADTLQNSPVSFKILTEKNVDEAQLLLKGHVTKMEESRGIKKWMGGKKYLTIQGSMIDQKTQSLIANFNFSVVSGELKADYKKLGYQIGEQIGQFILSHLN